MGDAFVAVAGRLDPAMVVVTAAGGGEVDGCLVGFHSQSSIDPPRYVVWLSVANRTYRLATDASSTHLGVHVIGAAQIDLAERFGGETGDDVDKLADLSWSPGPGGVPRLDVLPDRFVGRILERLEVAGGDHVAFVLEPERAEAPGEPGAATLRLSGVSDIDAGHPA